MLDTSKLTVAVELKKKDIVKKTITLAVTAALFIGSGNVQMGVKGEAPILKMDADVVIQDGSGCARNPLTNAALSDVKIRVKPMKDEMNLCPKVLYNTYFSWALKTGQDPEQELLEDFAMEIGDIRAKKIAEANEIMIWQGDTTLTGANVGNLKMIDGIIKQLEDYVDAGEDVIDLNGLGGTGVTNKLQLMALKMPAKIRKQDDFRLFVGEEVYDYYLMELANKNIYKPTDDTTLFGTTVKLQPVPGLNETGKVVAGRLQAFQLGLDQESDADDMKFSFSKETNQYYMDFYWALGVKVVQPDEVGYGEITLS